jgi:hypothetical protein
MAHGYDYYVALYVFPATSSSPSAPFLVMANKKGGRDNFNDFKI